MIPPEFQAFVPGTAFYAPSVLLAGVLLDRCLGEPQRWHPLAAFGRYAQALEERLNRRRFVSGLLAWSLAVPPFVASTWIARRYAPWLVDCALLYFALGAQSLAEHAEAVARALRGEGADDASACLAEARRRVGMIVSRQTERLDESGVATACVESVLENGNDAVFGALFWFAVLGGPGVLLFRLANTLDAMWGYRTERFNLFGRVAARIDDALNYLPARLTALSYALLGRTGAAWRCWRMQAPAWESPNAGPVMASGAGSLGVRLGGVAIYHGREEVRPPLGEGAPPVAADIPRAVALVRRGAWLWLAVVFAVAWLAERGAHA